MSILRFIPALGLVTSFLFSQAQATNCDCAKTEVEVTAFVSDVFFIDCIKPKFNSQDINRIGGFFQEEFEMEKDAVYSLSVAVDTEDPSTICGSRVDFKFPHCHMEFSYNGVDWKKGKEASILYSGFGSSGIIFSPPQIYIRFTDPESNSANGSGQAGSEADVKTSQGKYIYNEQNDTMILVPPTSAVTVPLGQTRLPEGWRSLGHLAHYGFGTNPSGWNFVSPFFPTLVDVFNKLPMGMPGWTERHFITPNYVFRLRGWDQDTGQIEDYYNSDGSMLQVYLRSNYDAQTHEFTTGAIPEGYYKYYRVEQNGVYEKILVQNIFGKFSETNITALTNQSVVESQGVTTTSTLIAPGASTVWGQLSVSEKDGVIISQGVQFFDAAKRNRLVSSSVDPTPGPNGVAGDDLITSYTYNEAAQVTSVVQPADNWIFLEYPVPDISVEYRPYLSSCDLVVTDGVAALPTSGLVIKKTVGDLPGGGKVYKEFLRNLATAEEILISERGTQEFNIGANNEYLLRRSYELGNTEVSNYNLEYSSQHVDPALRGKMVMTWDATGKAFYYTYASGTWSNGSFASSPTGLHLKTSEFSGALDLANISGTPLPSDFTHVPGHSLRKSQIYIEQGISWEETAVCTDGAGTYAPAKTFQYEYETAAPYRLTGVKCSGRYVSKTEYVSDLIRRDWSEDGTCTETEENAYGETIRTTVIGSGSVPTKEITYTSLGNTQSSFRGAQMISQTIQDGAGRVVSETDESGATTTYSYSDGGRITTTTRPGQVTHVESRHYDGKSISTTGTGVVPIFYEYGIELDGSSWMKESTASVNSPRYTITRYYRDGSVWQVEKPNPQAGGDPIIASYEYDPNTGELLRVASSAPNVADEIRASVLDIENITNEERMGHFQLQGRELAGGLGPVISSTDRLSSTESSFVLENGVWYEQTIQKTYQVDNSTSHLLTSSKSALAPEPISHATYGDGLRRKTVQTGAGFIITSHTDHYFDQSITLSTSDDSRTATSPDQTSMSRHGSMVETKAFGSDAAATVVYNSAGRVQSETNPLGGITRYFYNGAGQLEIQRDHLNRETSFEYYPATHMSAGLLKKTIDANGGVTEIIYNERGEQTEVSGSATQKIVYEYNAYGERTGMRTWRVTGGAGDLTQWVYEPATGLQKEKIDAAGKKTNYTYYPSGLVYQRTNARNMTTTLTYNEYGDPLTTVYSSGTANVTRTFDRLGREKTVQDASGLRTITYHTQNGMPDLINYNNTGALASRSLDYIFDGQLLPSGYAATGVSSVAYGYDPQGRLMQVSSGSLAHNYSYLAGTGLQNQRTSSHTGSLRLTETRIIDRMGRLDSIRTANAAGAVLSLHAYQFDQLNRRKEAAREDGRRWHYDYNSRGELESAVKFTADGSKALPAHRFGYDYDGMGNLNSSTRSVGTDPTPVIQRNYVANNLNQYTSITTPGDFTVLAEVPASVATSAVSLAGSLGNRTENIIAWYRNVTNGTTGVLASNSVVMNTAPQQTITGSTYVPKNLVNPQYDFDGNLTDDGLWTYTWDAENRLTSMAMKSNVGYSTRIQLDFIYDSENRRVSKAVSTTTASTWTLQSTTRFLYDGWNMIAQYGFSGSTFTPQAEYVWGLDLTGDMQGAGGVGGLLHARLIDTGNALCLPCYDGNGNIAAWFDAGTSTLIDRREYDSFGGMVSLYKLTANATLHSKLHFGFSTKFTDSESGFLYYGHRYYNPVTQRWLNRDPIEEEGGVNLYGFVGNDGVNFIDYLGMKITKRQVNEYTVMPNPNLPLGLGFTEGQISTVVTFGDGGVIFGPSPQKVNVPDGLKITKIEASSKGNEFKNTEKHELVHVEIYVRYTNMLADEINWLEREFCNPCYELAAAYGNAAANLRRLQTAIENNMFDVQDYTATGRASSAILRVTNERNTNLGKLSAAVNAYNTTGAVFYANKKCITNGSKFIAGEF